MNDTTRDELVEQVAKITDDLALSTADHERDGMLTSEYLSELQSSVDRIIALVTAARDAEIRERLEHTYDEFRCENTDGMGGLDQHSSGYLEGLSFAIGLDDDGTGGQG